MKYRVYGNPEKLVIHGGPGAIGGVSGLAITLDNCIEVLNYGQSIDEQIQEIKGVCRTFGLETPVLIGHSWGAWLSFIYACRYKVSKLILIACGAFEEKYLALMDERRKDTLTPAEYEQVDHVFQKIQAGESVDMKAFGHLMSKMDAYDMMAYEDEMIMFDHEGHKKLMDELRPLRKSGRLVQDGKKIDAEILVIHGKEDSHPVEGVIEPLQAHGISFKYHVLEKCGHTPWHEKHASRQFFDILKKELNYLFRSERLGFRRFQVSDREFFRQMNADDEVMKFFPYVLDADASDAFLSRIISNYDKGYGLYAVEIMETETLIGFIGLAAPTFEADFTPCIEIGWRLHKDYWRKGYAKEGAARVMTYAKDQLKMDQLYSFTSVTNIPSIAVMKAIGLQFVEEFDHPRVEGALKRHVLYKSCFGQEM